MQLSFDMPFQLAPTRTLPAIKKQPARVKHTPAPIVVSEVVLPYIPEGTDKVTNSRDVADILRPVYGQQINHIEKMFAVYLNRANQIVDIKLISTGGVSGCLCDPRVVLQGAIMANASGIILSHNHPSGNLRPSDADYALTAKMKDAVRLLDMQLLDHVIVTHKGYYSFADEGKL